MSLVNIFYLSQKHYSVAILLPSAYSIMAYNSWVNDPISHRMRSIKMSVKGVSAHVFGRDLYKVLLINIVHDNLMLAPTLVQQWMSDFIYITQVRSPWGVSRSVSTV